MINANDTGSRRAIRLMRRRRLELFFAFKGNRDIIKAKGGKEKAEGSKQFRTNSKAVD
jgi:hypothetical protein